VGESWELVDLDQHVSHTDADKRSLGTLWRSGALGASSQGRFPFLLKWLDARECLSVQVHPDEAAAKMIGADAVAKSEAWYVAQADSHAEILLGFKEGTSPEKAYATYGTRKVVDLMQHIVPREGMLIAASAGVVHAIGAGLLLLEVQQPSDSTYRIYAWDRPDVALHVDNARLSTRWGQRANAWVWDEVIGPGFRMRKLRKDDRLHGSDLRVLVCVGTQATLRIGSEESFMHLGDVWVMDRHDGDVALVHGDVVWVGENRVDTVNAWAYDLA
jgi:mannose-6-phosphate isomerase class I